MKYEFISRMEVVERKGSRIKKRLLTIFIVIVLVIAVLEIIINGSFPFVFLVPMLYIITFRRRLGKGKYTDVPMEISLAEETITILIHNAVRVSKKLYQKQYVVNKNDVKRICWSESLKILQMQFNGQCNVITDDNQIKKTYAVTAEKIQFYLPENIGQNILDLFSFHKIELI